ncbi:MAG: hypothetical protein FWF76_01970 [Oscillospiraceae bacterium]|nr:hypothetical protein [Oscillospiraceae bacterium]
MNGTNPIIMGVQFESAVVPMIVAGAVLVALFVTDRIVKRNKKKKK